MNDLSNRTDSAALRQIYRAIARKLIEKHHWTLQTEHDLVEMALGASQPPNAPTDAEQHIKGQYNIVLFDACRQTHDQKRCEQAYTELFHYLYRAAYNRWPDLAEDVTQQALLLVHEHIARCANPAAFRSFALFQLLRAYKELIRRRRDSLPLDDLVESTVEGDAEALDTPLLEIEQFQMLMDAIGRLPDRRQRDVVLLKYFEGLSDAEIHERLNITVGHIRVLRNRALNMLRGDTTLRTYNRWPGDETRRQEEPGEL
jgi:RNA polymerase sigma factor (sigma-70 family)